MGNYFSDPCKNPRPDLGPMLKEVDVKNAFNEGWRNDSITKNVINAVIAILTHSGHFYMVKGCDTGTIGFPGGRIDRTDRTILNAALRELKEETNTSLPLSRSGVNGLSVEKMFIFKGHTAIIFAKIPKSSRVKIDDAILPKFKIDTNGEICRRFLMRPRELYNLSLPRLRRERYFGYKETLRRTSICSTREFIKALNLTTS